MATIERFEDILSWKQARVLANMIYDFTNQSLFVKDFGLRDQIQRSSGSVMHNIAEGFEAGYTPEFIKFLKYARRSAGEVQSQLYLALDRKYISQEQFNQAYNKSIEVKKLINAFIGYLRSSKTPKAKDEPSN